MQIQPESYVKQFQGVFIFTKTSINSTPLD